MRPYFTEAGDALAALAYARQASGVAPPLDWAAAAIERGLLLQPVRRRTASRRARALRRRGLLAERVS